MKVQLVIDALEKAAAAYDCSPLFPMCGQRLIELANLSAGSRVLDIATGTGARLSLAGIDVLHVG
jgi:ubiquinone/menaquinone biosynthesis C-methylase UbiE